MFLSMVPAFLGARTLCLSVANFGISSSRRNIALAPTTVMVTGASRGLGLEFVKQLVQLPVPPEVLIAACRNPETATSLQAVARTNPSVKVVKLDVERDEDIEAAYKQSKVFLGERGLNLLINNAGIYNMADGTLPNQTRQMMQRHFDVNVSGPIMVTQKFLPLLKQAAAQSQSAGLSCNKAGIIMITTYMGSQTITHSEGAGTAFHYKCSKSALTMSAVMMSRELRESGIFVAAIHPGWVRTDMGSQQAPLLPEDSARACLKVISNADDSSTGKLISYEGETLPY